MSKPLAVIAIGGNSLIRSKQLQKVEDQHDAIRQTVAHVADLIAEGYQVLISHGNGPQVGFIMRRSEIARQECGLHLVPMVNAVADTQGSIGYQIQQSLGNELARRGLAGQCATIITQVQVAEDDPGFAEPKKPVGEFYDESQLSEIRRDYPDWTLVEDAGRGWRRVVASPKPVSVVEMPIIKSLMGSGCHVVAVGGGGIPVVRTERGYRGRDAVIDKDWASSMLASDLGAEILIISTAVPRVALNFGKPDQKDLAEVTVAQVEEYIAEEHFAPGSMLPKVQAAIKFLKNGGKRVIITSPENIQQAVTRGEGTHIVP